MKNFFARFGILSFILGALIGGFTGTALAVYQPHMVNAMTSLKNAQYELNQATENKNGHREKALSYIASAIQEVHWGIEAGNANQ